MISFPCSSHASKHNIEFDTQSSHIWHKILIVEDIIPEKARLEAILRKEGYFTYSARNGKDAIPILDTHPIGLIISDWRMPVMNGMELLSQIKLRFTSQPYFIVLTGQNAIYDLAAALDAGADDYINKPFSGEELCARVKAGSRQVKKIEQLKNQHKCLN